jgi:hypothetical protein
LEDIEYVRPKSISSGSLENGMLIMFSHPNVVLEVLPSPCMNITYQTLNTEESCKAHTWANSCDQPISSRKCVGSKCKHPTNINLFFVSHVSWNPSILQQIGVPTPTFTPLWCIASSKTGVQAIFQWTTGDALRASVNGVYAQRWKMATT